MQKKSSPLAIIGISCLFPKADDLQSYWANIKNGVDAITPIPVGTHWNAADYFNPDPKAPDHTYAQRGGFLSPVNFNPMEFGISPKDIEATDTTQLLSLIGAQQALQNAGYAAGNTPGRNYDRERTSVILGVTGALELVIPLGARLGHPHWRRALKDAGVDAIVAEDVVQRIADSYVGWQENSFPGLLGNVAAGRIASRLDLGGTNCVVDAACASSLAAIHLASLELDAGRSDMVITGGVDTFNDIFMYMCFSKTPALSPSGDAKPFNSDCDGTVLGEGLGMLVLKRLEDATRDGDRIYAVLKGTASSSDGRSSAIYAPRADGQKLALQRAYEIAGVTPDTIGLVEAHGTGTKVGDATELSSLREVFTSAGRDGSWCALGSVKSQIGHTKAAAGVAGIIKAAMALHQKVLPPTIKVSQPLAGAAPGRSPFYVNTRKRPWLPEPAHPRRAGVSALGFGGTNFHCVLEEPQSTKPAIDWDGDVEILAFACDSLVALKSQVSALDTNAAWLDFRRMSYQSRQGFAHEAGFRLLMVVGRESDRENLKNAALSMLEKNADKTSWTAPIGIAFGAGKTQGKIGALFPGQGSQYVGMLRDLACQFPAMLEALTEADGVFASDKGKPEVDIVGVGKLSDYIYPHPAFDDASRLAQEQALKSTDIAQPALGAVNMGALGVLKLFGVTPHAASGHSYGELAALCGAGRISAAVLHHLSNIRGQLMASKSGGSDRGAMLAVLAEEPIVQAFVDAFNAREHKTNDAEDDAALVIANRNSPKQFVLAGSKEAIDRAARELSSQSIRASILAVSAAFHSPLVADARAPFAKALEDVEFAAGEITVYANASGQVYPQAELEARVMLADQIVRPVRFVEQIEAMYHDGVRTFIEVGPGHVLGDLAQAILADRDIHTIALDASKGQRSGIFDLGLALCRIASLGHVVKLAQWENAPAALETNAKKPAMTIALSGANYRAPQTPRPPVIAPPNPVSNALPPQTFAQVEVPKTMKHADVPVRSSVARGVAPAGASPVSGGGAMQDIPAALRAAQEGILALQRLQEQTALLHKQFLEGQESARRAIQSLLGLQSGNVAAPVVAQPVEIPERMAPVAVASAQIRSTPVVATTEIKVATKPLNEVVAPNQAVGSTNPTHIEEAVLRVVSDKTGYPVEMLNLDMGMDSDLGIDSIKRVEIMAALRGILPNAPEIKPEHLGTLQTLAQVVAHLARGTSDKSSADVASSSAAKTDQASDKSVAVAAEPSLQKIRDTVLAVVADKTGYPVEMLSLDMGMDSDLGIDSIKRVEIMASVRGLLPGAPEIKPEHLGVLQTLEQVVEFLSGGQSATAPRGTPIGDLGALAPSSAAFSVARIGEALLAVVAEKTGYPVDMLNLDMGMDSDLGIDSIKRVEIMASLRQELPGSPEIRPEQLGSLQTLRQVVEFLAADSGGPSSANIAPAQPASHVARDLDAATSVAQQAAVLRQVVRPMALGNEGREVIHLPKGSLVWLTDDGSLLCSRIEGRLRARGLMVLRGDIQQKAFGNGGAMPAAVVIVAPAAGAKEGFLKHALRLMQLAAPSLRKLQPSGVQSILATVSRLDGAFGFNKLGAKGDAISGGLAGLVKTARREWPEVSCKALDLDPDNLKIEEAAEEIVAELFLAGPVEVGISSRNRVQLEIVSAPLDDADRAASLARQSTVNQPRLNPGDLVIVTGGARGVTGESALELARVFQPTLVLLGRSELAEAEPLWLQDLNSEAEIKKAIYANLVDDRSPKAVEAEYSQLLARREIRTQLARIEATGARAIYRAVDVRDALAVAQIVSDVRLQFGPIRGLVHGAGVLADRRIEDKTEEQFDQVYGTKVLGLENLLGALANDDLRVLALFSSYTGRYGRVGQVDYAAANEVLNKLAQVEARRRPACRVLSINWGPWNGGMVTPALAKIFRDEGVGLIEPAAGAQFLVREIRETEAKHVEVLAIAPSMAGAQPGDQPPSNPLGDEEEAAVPLHIPTQHIAAGAKSLSIHAEGALAFEREVSVKALPCLESHVLNGRAVLPAALMVEWLAQAALHGNPGMAFHGLDNFKVLKGLVLETDQSVTVSLHAGESSSRANLLAIPVRMSSRSGDRLVLHAEAEVLLTTEKLPVAPAPALNNVSSGGFNDAYTRGVLFHGADLHGIQSVEGCTELGVAATVKGAPSPRSWIKNPLRGTWIADPLALDSAFQMMILWSSAHRAAPSLPSALARYRQFVSAFPKNGCRVVIGVALGITAMAVATIEFLDDRGNLLAAAEGCECVVDASLSDAFRLNRLGLEK
ncbi:MAG: SDR family NAD(P)-dependent oxidoreductase [Burkholderiales bacterium]